MQNILQKSPYKLAGQGAEIAQGAEEHAATIDLGVNTAVNIRLDITGLTTANTAYGAAKTELTTRRDALDTVRAQVRKYLLTARDSFRPTLGYEYNPTWDETGLVGSLKITTNSHALLPLLSAFGAYLTAHPALEVASKGITAARAQELYDDLDDAIGAVNSQITAVKAAYDLRQAKLRKLHIRLRGTIASLSQALGPLDPRWESFGLNRPGIKARPPQPLKLTGALIGPRSVSITWERTPRAEYYRIWLKVDGIDTEFQPVGTPTTLGFLLADLPAATKVEIAVSAVNNGGESLRSEIYSVTTQ